MIIRLLVIFIWGRFHPIFFAKGKVAGAQRLVKNLQLNFINILSLETSSKLCKNLPKFIRRLLSAIRPKSFSSCLRKKVRQKCW